MAELQRRSSPNILRRLHTVFRSGCAGFHSVICAQGFPLLHFSSLLLPAFASPCLWAIDILTDERWHCGLDLFPCWVECWAPLHVPVGHLCVFFGKMSKSFCLFLNWIIFTFAVECMRSFYILDSHPLSDVGFIDIFFPILQIAFSFCWWCLLLCRSSLVSCLLCVCCLCFWCQKKKKNHCQGQHQGAYCLGFLLGVLRFQVVCSSLESNLSIYVWFKMGSSFILSQAIPVSQHHCPFLTVYSWCLCWKLIDHIPVGLFIGLVLCSIELCVCFMPIPHCFDDCSIII